MAQKRQKTYKMVQNMQKRAQKMQTRKTENVTEEKKELLHPQRYMLACTCPLSFNLRIKSHNSLKLLNIKKK